MSTWKKPSVIVCKEKHQDRYFDACDEYHFLINAQKILAERYDSGYWHEDPDGPFCSNVRRALYLRDGELCWRLLRQRDEYEYERVYLEPLEGQLV